MVDVDDGRRDSLALVTNRLFYGDNLDVLRNHVADASVDLVYLDPPFNSNRAYNVIFARQAASADAPPTPCSVRTTRSPTSSTWRHGSSSSTGF